MSMTALAIFTVVGATLVIGFTVCMFIVFSRFLNSEKEAAEKFRAQYKAKKEQQ